MAKRGDRNALGYFGFAYFLEAGDALKAVEIDGGDGCVAPSFDAALDGSYVPLARPLPDVSRRWARFKNLVAVVATEPRVERRASGAAGSGSEA